VAQPLQERRRAVPTDRASVQAAAPGLVAAGLAAAGAAGAAGAAAATVSTAAATATAAAPSVGVGVGVGSVAVEQRQQRARAVCAVRVAPELHGAVVGSERVARVGARAARCTEGRAELHDGLVELARPRAAARLDELSRQRPRELAVGAVGRLLGAGRHRVQPRGDAEHIAVNDRSGHPAADRRDRARRVPPDALDACASGGEGCDGVLASAV